jgi:hypothetical protein
MNKPMLRRQFLVAAGGTVIAAPAAANVFATRSAAEVDQTGNQARLFAGCCDETCSLPKVFERLNWFAGEGESGKEN